MITTYDQVNLVRQLFWFLVFGFGSSPHATLKDWIHHIGPVTPTRTYNSRIQEEDFSVTLQKLQALPTASRLAAAACLQSWSLL